VTQPTSPARAGAAQTAGVRSWVLLLVLLAAIALLWNTWAIYPLKLLVVFFHELAHALAAVLTGGSVEEIRLSSAEGGLCVTRGGVRFVVLTAGYLGSMAIGGVILLGAARSGRDRGILVGLGIVLLAVTLLVVRPWFGFGMVFGLLAGAALLAAGRFLGPHLADGLLRVIGLTSVLYAVLDLKSDVLNRPELPSDARLLAEHTGIPTLVWGTLWSLAALAAAFFLVRAAARDPASDAPLP
jgi:hypothetical protein